VRVAFISVTLSHSPENPQRCTSGHSNTGSLCHLLDLPNIDTYDPWYVSEIQQIFHDKWHVIHWQHIWQLFNISASLVQWQHIWQLFNISASLVQWQHIWQLFNISASLVQWQHIWQLFNISASLLLSFPTYRINVYTFWITISIEKEAYSYQSLLKLLHRS